MGRSPVSDYLKKRDLLNDAGLSSDEAKKIGEMCLEDGLIHDALEFFGKAGYEEGLRHILEMAREEGDYFIADAALRFLKEDWSSEGWLELAKRAEELQKFVFASQAYKRAGAGDDAARLMFVAGNGAESAKLDTRSSHA
ncbi:MAG: hypothetical protein JRI45_01880 [Deltaproteobacteria bacterium]|nr:hypothetical protein [Deltaproteobacteria bacterium]MBW2068069.1 hypothetical protein [Deltaproteobacteria bacterium]